MLSFTCKVCGSIFEVDDTLSGKLIKCRECDELGRVPERLAPLTPKTPRQTSAPLPPASTPVPVAFTPPLLTSPPPIDLKTLHRDVAWVYIGFQLALGFWGLSVFIGIVGFILGLFLYLAGTRFLR